LLGFSIIGKAQTFCDTMFGRNFKLEIKGESSIVSIFNFKKDSFDFYQYKPLKKYYLFRLNCNDSSFRVSICEDDISSITGNGFTIESLDFGNLGIWKYDSITKFIIFKLIDSTKWHHFKIKTKGSIQDNPYINWAGNGDYRYLIRLIAIKE